MDIVQGPDFPGGGQIISPRQAIIDAYTSGEDRCERAAGGKSKTSPRAVASRHL
jgi:DNA gyrase/topoisomerase IV subunit A